MGSDEKYHELAWLGLGDIRNIVVPDNLNPLLKDYTKFKEYPGLDVVNIMRNPDYLHYAAKLLLNVQLLPFQAAILKQLWIRPFPMFLASRGASKSYLLAVYAMLKCILGVNQKVVIVGSAFRQAKVIYEYCESIWSQADILRDICSQNSGCRRDVDRCYLRINDNMITAIPLGSGEKIRGLRATCILADEFSCLSAGSLVETEKGLIRIEDFDSAENTNLVTGNSVEPLEKPSKFIKTPLCDVFEIKTRNGYTIKCSENHQVMTNNGWKKPLELIPNVDWIECENHYQFPSNENSIIKDKDLAWLMGMLISEGSIVNKNQIQITTIDEHLLARLTKMGFSIYTRKSHIDYRGWNCKKCYQLYMRNTKFREQLYKLGLDYVTAHNKKIPWSILQSSEEMVWSFLSGMFEGDGSCFLWKDAKRNNHIGVAYYSISKQLCRDVQIVLNKLGYDGYINKRKSEISDNSQWFVRYNGKCAYKLGKILNIDRFQNAIQNCFVKKDPTYICFVKTRNVWKVQYNYCGKIHKKQFKYKNDAQLYLNKLQKLPNYKQVVSIIKLDEQEHLYDYYLPKTHSFYADGFRQHNSIPIDIYSTVVAGFAAVSSNPVANVQEASRRESMSHKGVWTADEEFKYQARGGNQAIISGTCSYDFEHLYDYWNRYKSIINSRGDKRILAQILDADDLTKNFNWRDYSIIRLPYELVPDGFMDSKQIARAKATVHTGIYDKEYSAVFVRDSSGFFKRSLIEGCTAKPKNINGDNWPSWCPSPFTATVRGSSALQYVIGIDPASERDNFSIIVLELHGDHTRVVYCWTTNRKDFRERIKRGLVKENDFYSFCARKIRDLMKVFPCSLIGMDAMGGGIAVEEALHDPDKIYKGELPIWPVIDPDKAKDTDDFPGLHILQLCQFVRADWTAEANHGLRKDMEDKVLLFPHFDSVTLGLSAEDDKACQNKFEKEHPQDKFYLYDSLEDCMMEIEALKDELCTIIMTRVGSSTQTRDRWDTPEIKTPEGKKARMRKDRYSSLVIANMIARTFHRAPEPTAYEFIGGRSDELIHGQAEGPLYRGPDWFTSTVNENIIGRVIRKQR